MGWPGGCWVGVVEMKPTSPPITQHGGEVPCFTMFRCSKIKRGNCETRGRAVMHSWLGWMNAERNQKSLTGFRSAALPSFIFSPGKKPIPLHLEIKTRHSCRTKLRCRDRIVDSGPGQSKPWPMSQEWSPEGSISNSLAPHHHCTYKRLSRRRTQTTQPEKCIWLSNAKKIYF